MVQPDCPKCRGATLWAGETCLLSQVSPPSREAALSAQICSLSAKVAEDCLLAITGRIQLFLSATIWGVRAGWPSRRETAIASNPLKVCSSRSAEKFDVKLAKYSRD